jgi:hypothetical protein
LRGRRSDQKRGPTRALEKEIHRAKGSSCDVSRADDARPVATHLIGGWNYDVDT